MDGGKLVKLSKTKENPTRGLLWKESGEAARVPERAKYVSVKIREDIPENHAIYLIKKVVSRENR
ncbi:MAG: hypothetical protein PWQ60_1338 [Thermoanaerobacteraceae bacterium]|nr:hypothetical protein [Thermoanaerobacteraceae bacterium]